MVKIHDLAGGVKNIKCVFVNHPDSEAYDSVNNTRYQCFDAGPASQTVDQRQTNIGSTCLMRPFSMMPTQLNVISYLAVFSARDALDRCQNVIQREWATRSTLSLTGLGHFNDEVVYIDVEEGEQQKQLLSLAGVCSQVI